MQDFAFSISMIGYLDQSGMLSSSWTSTLDPKILLRGYEVMVLTRQIDERMLILQRQGTITFSISSRGEEACAVASAAALQEGDWMYPQYRESGILFWRGFSAEQYIHHMFSNALDLSKGRQMPNHFGSRKHNVVTVSSPIGTKIPHAAGCAYAMKLQGEKNVAICYFGEGASSEGDFHAGLNFAAVRKAPVIFFCRNNGFAISTPCAKQFVTDGVSPEAVGHGITTYRVDGNDFFAVYETVAKARKLCLEGNGPVFIEAMTYRLRAHSSSDDPSRYRDEKQLLVEEKKCPIMRLKRYLESKQLWNETKEQELQERIKKEIDRAIDVAKATPAPDLETLIEDVYANIPPTLQAQLLGRQRDHD